MAKVPAHGSRVWLDEIPLASYLSSSDLSVEQEVADVTTFGDAGPRRVVGNYSHSGSLGGFFDGADDAFDEQAFVNFQTDEDHYLFQTLGASAEGSVGYERVIRLKSQPRSSKLGGAVLLNLEDEGAGPMVRGKILRSATVTGTGDGTGQNIGATTGETVVVTYRVLAITGGAITLQIHDSDDDGDGDAYASISALASGSLAAVGVTRMTTTGTTKDWKRVTVSAMTASSATILVTIGTAPNS